MVARLAISSIVGFAIALTVAVPCVAEPVDWATSGGDLFVTAGLPDTQTAANIERLISLPVVPARPTRRPPAQSRPPVERQRLDAVPIPEPQPTEDYSEVRLLPSNQPLDELITKIAIETGLDPKLLHALVIIESAYNTRAVSPVGARGLTQLMPGTAAELGVRDVFNTEQNLRAGARYLAIQIGRFSDIRLALAAYNAGPNRVARLGRVPDFTETQNYVRDGIDCYLALTAGRGIRNRSQCRTRGR
jgi:soluble lytic murein transglycosylase-like protein